MIDLSEGERLLAAYYETRGNIDDAQESLFAWMLANVHHLIQRCRDADAMEAALKLNTAIADLLRACRPHVSMSVSVTSGREFQDGCRALLSRIDKALGETP